MKSSIYMLLLMVGTVKAGNIPPIGTFFWVANTGARFISNTGNHIVFRPAG